MLSMYYLISLQPNTAIFPTEYKVDQINDKDLGEKLKHGHSLVFWKKEKSIKMF